MKTLISKFRGTIGLFGLFAASLVQAESAGLEGTPLGDLEVFLGNWEVDTHWSDGTPLWARNEFRVGLGGNFIEARSFTKDENDEVYERYYTIFANETERNTITSYGYTYDGTVTIIRDINLEHADGMVIMTTEWTAGTDAVRQTVRATSGDTYSWKVWAKGDGQADWSLIMDADYRRVH